MNRQKFLGGFKQKRNLFLFITLILLIGLISIGASYAYWRFTYAQNDFNTLGVSCFEVTLTNEENNIQLESAMPIRMKKIIYNLKVLCLLPMKKDYYLHLIHLP